MTLKIVQLDTVGSTNDYALDLISDMTRKHATTDATEWVDIAVLADMQTAGRGRMNSRTWISTRGNFHCSYIINLDKLGLQEHGTAGLNPIVLHAIVTLLTRLGSETDAISIKAPNDVMIHDKKISGVLIETSYPHAVIGIGINTVVAPIQTSTSILKAFGIQVSNTDIATQLHSIITAECSVCCNIT
ncbi:MAG: biotin--[acetyl-CoA-carboxylase] ligase [Holosporales bacterium]|jgi:BirA family biotin operon repressor/biotin-[acetyl-CoA-carboxylase] ligase|nr:biotin--[acetyl-CoA-carboxylase] ligase [Holosporales bacterium]